MLENINNVKNGIYKSKGGLIKTKMNIEDDIIKNIRIYGDFFFYPEDKLFELEKLLIGKKKDDILELIAKFYKENKIESPGLEPNDFILALFGKSG